MSIDIGVDTKYLQQISHGLPTQMYSISRCLLPNAETTVMTETIISKALEHAEKLGKIKAIYNYPNYQYVVEFGHLK